jgi:hypothetical protein
MKEGSSLQELAKQLEAEQKSKRDFIAPTTELERAGGDILGMGDGEWKRLLNLAERN